MSKLFFIVALVALAAGVIAIEFKPCLPVQNTFNITTVDLEPAVFHTEREGSAVINVTISDALAAGFGAVTVKDSQGRIVTKHVYSLCEHFIYRHPCPLKGSIELRVPVFTGQDAPRPGTYSVDIDVFSQDSKQLACISFEVEVDDRARENCASCGTSSLVIGVTTLFVLTAH
jgi:hypothetical protein